MIAALQFLTTGVLSELISRTYFESSQRQQYAIYNRQDDCDESGSCWAEPGQKRSDNATATNATAGNTTADNTTADNNTENS